MPYLYSYTYKCTTMSDFLFLSYLINLYIIKKTTLRHCVMTVHMYDQRAFLGTFGNF